MEFTWIAILASLAMGMGTAFIFIFAVKGNYFQNLEDAKYHVFWSDLEDLVDGDEKEGSDGQGADNSEHGRESRHDD